MADKRPTKLHEEIIAREQLKESTSKGQLVPFKPQTKVSPLAKIGQFAGKVARRNPLIEIIAQLLPGKEQVSKNIEGAKEQAKIAEMTRREFLRRSGGVVANQLAGNPLMQAIVRSVGNIPDAPIPIPQPSLSIEEIIMEELIRTRDNPEARAQTIKEAINSLGIPTTDPEGTRDMPTPTITLAKKLDKALGLPDDPRTPEFEPEDSDFLGTGSAELEPEIESEFTRRMKDAFGEANKNRPGTNALESEMTKEHDQFMTEQAQEPLFGSDELLYELSEEYGGNFETSLQNKIEMQMPESERLITPIDTGTKNLADRLNTGLRRTSFKPPKESPPDPDEIPF